MKPKSQVKSKADIVEEQLEKIGNDLFLGKGDLKISKEYHNNVGKRVAVANGQSKQNERGHTLAVPFYGITAEMEKSTRKPKRK